MLSQQLRVALGFPAALPPLLLAPPQWAWLPLLQTASPTVKQKDYDQPSKCIKSSHAVVCVRTSFQ